MVLTPYNPVADRVLVEAEIELVRHDSQWESNRELNIKTRLSCRLDNRGAPSQPDLCLGESRIGGSSVYPMTDGRVPSPGGI